MEEYRWYKTGKVKTDECDACGEHLHLAEVLLHTDGECRDEWVCADCLGE